MTIRILNRATMRPTLPRLEVATFCLLVETNQGLVLVDTLPDQTPYFVRLARERQNSRSLRQQVVTIRHSGQVDENRRLCYNTSGDVN